MVDSPPEVWLRGPIEDVPPLLQPVAHALVQAQEDVHRLMEGFADDLLWGKPGGAASAGFHLQHLVGILDRLFTYARGGVLTGEQLQYLRREGTAPDPPATAQEFVARFDAQVSRAIEQLRRTHESSLTEAREVGRQRLPSTVLGLLVHAAEHTQRHVGQLLVTVRVQRRA